MRLVGEVCLRGQPACDVAGTDASYSFFFFGSNDKQHLLDEGCCVMLCCVAITIPTVVAKPVGRLTLLRRLEK